MKKPKPYGEICNPDLFGGVSAITGMAIGVESQYQRFRRLNHYNKSTNWKQCKNCVSFIRQYHHNKYYFKCAKMGESRSAASDIQAGGVCNLWEDAGLD